MSAKKKLAGSIALGLALVLGCTAPALADSRKVVTLGADLTTDQQNTMLRYFGVSSDSVDIIYINNTQEREQLGSYVPLEQIGTKTFSCALVAPTTSGGIQVKTANLSWVTCNMIASTLSTSGVTNCQVVAAAPFEVSGTGALTGVILAYETASGESLDSAKKDLANQELVSTGNLSDEVGQSKATAVINETKIRVIENNVTEINEITDIVNEVSNTYNVTIDDDESAEIAELMQKIAQQDYDITQLKATLDRVQANVAGDAGASEEEQAALESEAEASEQAALEEAQSEAAESEAASDSSVVVIDETTGTEETENILDNTDSSALEEGGAEVEEGTTTQTVQEQSEAETEAQEDSSVTVIPEATGDETVQSEATETDSVVTVETSETTADGTASEESGEIPEATGDVTVETTADDTASGESGEIPEATGDSTSETTAETAAEETLTADMLDEEERGTYDSAKTDIDAIFEGDQVVSDDGATIVYLTSEAAQQVPEAIENYVLRVLAEGSDIVAEEEAADPSISQNVMEETQSLAEDANYIDPDVKQIDKYVRRLILQDSEGMLAESQLTEQDQQVVYGAVMDAVESAFDVDQSEEEGLEDAVESAAEELLTEAAAEAEEWLDNEGSELLDEVEEAF